MASHDNTARLMLVLLSLGWGTTWPMMRIALDEVPPFSMRVATMLVGVLTLAALTLLMGRTFALRGKRAAVHVVVAGLFNVVSFTVLTPFAQLHAATSRVSILVYSMPIWATLMARVFLRERLTGMRAAAFALCVAGLVVLISPLAAPAFRSASCWRWALRSAGRPARSTSNGPTSTRSRWR